MAAVLGPRMRPFQDDATSEPQMPPMPENASMPRFHIRAKNTFVHVDDKNEADVMSVGVASAPDRVLGDDLS